jgi:ABC-type multidrug transport system fused ATPase/permease subunit
MKTYKKLLFLLNPHERKKAILLIFMILIMALLDMIGIASILPFITVLMNPSLVETNYILYNLYQASRILGVENNQEFLFLLGTLVFVLIVTSLVFKALTTYVQIGFVMMQDFAISKRLVEGYLNQPYSWFLSRHSADLGKTILSQVGVVVGNGIRPLMELIAKGAIAIAIIFLLIIVDLKVALIMGFSLGFSYTIIYSFIKRYLKRIGEKHLKNNQLRFTTVGESFGAAKEVKVGGLEETYTRRYSDSAKSFARSATSSQIASQLPRFFLETISIGGVLLLILYLMRQSGTFNNILPIISLYVFAGYRLMPALQQVYSSFSQLTFAGPSIDKLYYEIKNLKLSEINQDQDVLSLNKSIILKNIFYNYPNSTRTALNNINLEIQSRTTVGIVGATGSGKTTTVDIILGLFEAQKGSLEVDGKIITQQNSRAWQRSIGYVPQHIFLTDDTVSANIAFGIEAKDIDEEAVEKASKIAKLHDFVTNELPNGYNTTVGERGVRLSGGQRQRIGIARALYHNPKVLILDEATSSLDNKTEQAVMEAINKLNKNITIIIIAHRLNTVKNCDVVFQFEKGEMVKQGSFDEVINHNERPVFQKNE